MKKITLKKLIAGLVLAGGATAAIVAPGQYQRSQFPHWVDADGDCQDTRQEVLIRDADGDLTMSKDGCTVIRGLWIDPYTGEAFENPKDLDVDHVVPLKNAWDNGAAAWTKEQRKQFANNLDNNYSLLAVKASENRKKGAKAPNEYMPPRKEFECEYLYDWLKIKNDWGLMSFEDELEAVIKMTKEDCKL